MRLLTIAITPIILILIYLNYRDKYEKEPKKLLIKAVAGGAITVIPIYFIEVFLGELFHSDSTIKQAFYDAFVVASFTEEVFKYLVFWILIWKNKNFNEFFDGIIYAVYISMGFAMVENVLYVLGSGHGVGILRALTAVPGHALFGVAMGYYFGLARFLEKKSLYYLKMALIVPIILHGIYDFILMSQSGWLLLLFIPFLIYMWIAGFRKMKAHSDGSQFKK
ncbi:MAG: PrsW family glutamic-type intramembrane protease [Bacteroidales bacterium]|nr:PrsW family glutamic-type intramembrane protease [Bacteroidales bacterium]